MTEKKKKHRREYLNDFKLQDSGEYKFEGEIYCVQTDDWNGLRKNIWFRTGLVCLLVLVSGFLPSAGMINTFYVILPYMAEVIIAALVVWGIYRMTKGTEKIRSYIYEKTYPRFHGQLFVMTILAVMVCIGEVIHLLLEGTGDKLGFTIASIIVQILVFLAAGNLMRYLDRISFTRE